MHNSFLKLTALAGAIGISCLVVLQVQQGPLESAKQAPSNQKLPTLKLPGREQTPPQPGTTARSPVQSPNQQTLQVQTAPRVSESPRSPLPDATPKSPVRQQQTVQRQPVPQTIPGAEPTPASKKPAETSPKTPGLNYRENQPAGYKRNQEPPEKNELAQFEQPPGFDDDPLPDFGTPEPRKVTPEPEDEFKPAENPAPKQPSSPNPFPLGEWGTKPGAKSPAPKAVPVPAQPASPPARQSFPQQLSPEQQPAQPQPTPMKERPVPNYTPVDDLPLRESRREERPAPPGTPLRQPSEVRPSSYNVPEREQPLTGSGTFNENVPAGPRQPQLKIEKVAPPKAVLGQPLVYHIIISNVGDSPANQVVVEDMVPRGANCTGTIPQAELIRDKLVWKLGTLKPNEQRKISIRVVPTTRGQIGSVATVNFVAEVTSRTTVTAPAFRLIMDTPPKANLGDVVALNFQMINNGSGDASGVVLYATLPAGLTHPEGRELEYVVGGLKAGETKKVSLQLTAVKSGRVSVDAGLKADGDYSTVASTSLEVQGSRLTLKRTGPRDRYLGRPAVYENLLTNNTRKPVQETAVVESIPEGMEFLEASHDGKYYAEKRVVVWRLGAIAAGDSVPLKIKLAPRKTGSMESLVKIYEPNGVRTETTSTTNIKGFASLGVDITEAVRPVAVGEKIPIRIRARNRGTISATNVKVTLTIPAELDVVDIKGPVKHTRNGNLVVFAPLDSLNENKQLDFDVILQARAEGDARLRVTVEGDQLQRPLTNEEAILVISENR